MPLLTSPLPTSTIVFALVTCIPFGLAIRDTVSGKYDDLADLADHELNQDLSTSDDSTDDHDQVDEDFEQRMRDDLARERALEEIEEEAEAKRHGLALRKLYSAEPAGLGELFEGVVLNGPESRTTGAVLERNERFSRTLESEITLLHNDGLLHTIYIKPLYAPRVCEALEEQLIEAWGEGHVAEDRHIWTNPATLQRAVFDTRSGCELRFEKLASVAQWLDRSPSSVVPMWALGQPAKRLTAKLGDRSTVSASEISWSTVGVGVGSGTTQITADVRNGKVVSLFVSVEAVPATQEAIIARVTELVGKPPQDDPLIWKTNPPIELQEGSAQMFLTIGKRPQD